MQTANDLQMLTQEDLYKLLNVGKDTLVMWREVGILKPIKTGRSYMFTQASVREFEKKFEGYDISNRYNAIKALNDIYERQNEEYNK